MPNSAEDYWSIRYTDGLGETQEVSLNQYAHGVIDWGGSGRGFPMLRGQESIYAYRVGQEFRPKIAAARTVTLEMFVNGLDADGGYTSTREFFQTNLAGLRRLFWKPNQQIELVRRWTTVDPTTKLPMQVSAAAKAQIAGVSEPEMTGSSRAMMSVDFLLSDPYFYSDIVTEVAFSSTTQDSVSLVNAGDDAVISGFEIILRGPIGVTLEGSPNPSPFIRLTNYANPQGVVHWLQYNAAVPDGQAVKIFVDVPACVQGAAPELLTSSGVASTLTATTGRLQYQGYSHPLTIFPTDNVVNSIGYTISGDVDFAGTDADIILRYRVPYV